MLTKEKIMSDYKKLKDLAYSYYIRADFEKALICLKISASIMYKFNVFFVDEDSEELISKISAAINLPNKNNLINNNNIVFYDLFALDNRGLTQQYLRALKSTSYRVLYVTYKKNQFSRMNQIIEEIKNSENIELVFLENDSIINTIKIMYKVFNNFSPSKIICHTAPDDVQILSVLNFFENRSERYLINITDHAFWLGTYFYDYFIEFRDTGYNLSRSKRNIEKQRLLKLPYYPIISKFEKPLELPFNPEKKRMVFSGGSLYKIYGGNNFYLKTVDYFLKNYSDTVLLYIGNGNKKPLLDFAKEKKLENRIFLMSERIDFANYIKKSFIYLNTYPMFGGLMSQIAVKLGKIPLTFSGNSFHNMDSFYLNDNYKRFTFCEKNDFYKSLDLLFSNKKYKEEIEKSLHGMIISEKEFNQSFVSLIDYQESFSEVGQNNEMRGSLFKECLESENRYLKAYSYCFSFQKYPFLIKYFKNDFIQLLMKRETHKKFLQKLFKK